MREVMRRWGNIEIYLTDCITSAKSELLIIVHFWLKTYNGLISGINFYMKIDNMGRSSDFSYSLNAGKIIAGALLVYFGNKLKQKEG